MVQQSKYTFLNVLILTVIISACGSPQERTITGKHIELDYRGVTTIEDGHWIDIDGVTFHHIGFEENAADETYAIPASVVETYKGEDADPDHEGKLLETFTGMDMALRINSFLYHIVNNDPERIRNNSKLLNTSEQLTMLTGRLRIAREDNAEFTIKVPADYPVRIFAVEPLERD